MSNKLTVVIVTRQRLAKLKRCLESISKQTELPDKVLVIDNDAKENSKKVALSFKRGLNVSYAVETRPGVPHARNRALRLCKTPLLGFTDDDCVLDKNWVKAGLNSMVKAKTPYVLGKSLLYNNKSVVALAQYYLQRYWFNQKLNESRPKTSPFNFDTKNIILKVSELKNHDLRFDNKFTIRGVDSSDINLGFQLETKDLAGAYEPKMVVHHEELESVLLLLRKAYLRGRLAFLVSHRWSLEGEFVNLPLLNWFKFAKSIRFWKKEYHNYTDRHPENVMQKILSFLLIKAYERVYLQGYVDEARKRGVNLPY